MLPLSIISLLLWGSWQDLRSREISDLVPISITVIAIAGMLLGVHDLASWLLILGLGVGLTAGYLLYRFAKLGGADAKLIAAMGAVVGPVGLGIVLFWMALAGGVLALIALARGARDYAYGPAILAGYLGYLGTVAWIILPLART